MAQDPFKESDLSALEKDIERRRMELEEDQRALARVRKMMSLSRTKSLNMANLSIFPSQGKIETPPINPFDDPINFNESVRRSVMGFTDRFTVPLVENDLIKRGVELPKKGKARQRIAMVLKRMRDNGKIEIVREGSGHVPHVYKVVVTADML